MGGQARRICTSFAPLPNKKLVVPYICVPRTSESSMSSSRLFSMSERMGISFMCAIRSRRFWLVGMNERGQVAVYLMNGRTRGMPERFA